MTDAELLELAAGLAVRAAGVILDIRARGFAVSRKADRSVVTEADRSSEALISAALREAAPEIPVIAEEAAADGAALVPSACFWLVDPLDGTKSFIRGSGYFTVNIGLIHQFPSTFRGRVREGVTHSSCKYANQSLMARALLFPYPGTGGVMVFPSGFPRAHSGCARCPQDYALTYLPALK